MKVYVVVREGAFEWFPALAAAERCRDEDKAAGFSVVVLHEHVVPDELSSDEITATIEERLMHVDFYGV